MRQAVNMCSSRVIKSDKNMKKLLIGALTAILMSGAFNAMAYSRCTQTCTSKDFYGNCYEWTETCY